MRGMEISIKIYLYKNLRKVIMSDRKKIIVAGHICVDIMPVFPDSGIRNLAELLVPGRLIEMSGIEIHGGGAVCNTGFALKALGADTVLMGKIGSDAIGDLTYSIAERYDAAEGLIRSGKADSSYTVAVSPPGIDRIFLHYPGTNDTFGPEDIDMDAVEEASIFHFGYPTLMRRMYGRGGEDYIRMLSDVRGRGAAVSVDLTLIDEKSEAAKADWYAIMEKALPLTDIFVPSAEEICYIIDRPRYREWQARGTDLAKTIDPGRDIAPLAEKLIEMGAKIVMIKCGEAGLYVAAADGDVLAGIGGGLKDKTAEWAGVRHFEKSFRPKRVLSGAGAGDTTIAAFLYAISLGFGPRRAAALAAGTGACCVEEYDSISGIPTMESLIQRIDSGWEKNS